LDIVTESSKFFVEAEQHRYETVSVNEDEVSWRSSRIEWLVDSVGTAGVIWGRGRGEVDGVGGGSFLRRFGRARSFLDSAVGGIGRAG